MLRLRRPSPAVVIALVALVAALVAPAWASRATGGASAASTVQYVKRSTTLTNNQVIQLEAPCPPGTRVFSGGVATTGQHTQWIVIGPARVVNKYYGYAYMPPKNINAGITQQTATITVVAYCAKKGKPIVM